MALFKSHGKHAPGANKNNGSKSAIDEQKSQSEAVEERQDEAAGKDTDSSENPSEVKLADSDETGSVGDAESSDAFGQLEGDEPLGFVSAASFEDMPSKKRRTGTKAVLITLGILVLLAAVVYFAGVYIFSTRFVANTTIDDNDISFMTDEEVVGLLEDEAQRYKLDITSIGFSYRLTSADIGLSVDAESIVAAMHDDLDSWQWPLLMMQSSHDESDLVAVSFNPDTYAPALTEALNQYNETARPPVNATIVYSEETGDFIVKPEEAGTQYDPEVVMAQVKDAITEMKPKLALLDDALIQPEILSTDEKLIEAAEIASGMVSADLTLVMAGQTVGEVNGDSLSDFVTIDENYEVVFREEEMFDWLDDLTSGYNTVGTARYYTRADGKEISVPAGGSYGWKIDTEELTTAIIDGVRAGAVDTIEVPCSSTAAVYNGQGERDWGNRYIDVDISEQYVRFYGDDGSIIWESDCVSGLPNGKRDTVPGTWQVNAKQSPSTLVGYENGEKTYETDVTYWMPFERNSIGFHDANWQAWFGGSRYLTNGSHGCVNLPYSAAEELYGIIQVGDVVVVHS